MNFSRMFENLTVGSVGEINESGMFLMVLIFALILLELLAESVF